MTGLSAGMSNGLIAHLTPYQVGLCSLLAQYAQDGLHAIGGFEKKLFDLLLREVQAAHGPQQKGLSELQRDLCSDAEGATLWEVFVSRLRAIDSPDALFDTFHGLAVAISREVASPSPLHAGGIFGHFARRCVLAFKDAPFEATVKLYDAVREYVAAIDALSCSAGEGRGARSSSGAGVAGAATGAGATVGVAADSCQLALGAPQVEQLAQGLMRDLPLSFGRVAFPAIDEALAALQGRLPLCHVVHFLRYVNSLQHRMADDAGSCLRSFHDGHQQRGLAELRSASGWPLGVPPEDGLPDLVQHASLALAGLHSEMRHLDDALQAIGESIRAAQEASDGSCLCACLYMMSLVLLQAGLTSKAFTMMRRCLHRAESLGLPMLQSLCCMGIARSLCMQPGLSDRRKRGLLWKESIPRMAAEMQPAAALRVQGAGAPGGGAGAPRPFGHGAGPGGLGGSRGGLGVLAALLGPAGQDEAGGGAAGGGATVGQPRDGTDGGGAASEGAACRGALAHATLASQLSTLAGPLGEQRPKVLLCQAEVARFFGLQPLTIASCSTILDIYNQHLAAEDRALALCQLAEAAAERSLAEAQPLLRGVARELPHAGHLWAHVVGPRLVQSLVRAGETSAASALLFQAAGVVRAVPHGSAASAAQRLRLAANGMRLYRGQLLAAYRSAREAVETGAGRPGTPGDICNHLLCLADVHLEAQDPIGALGPCMRCVSAAEHSRLLHHRAEAFVRIARVKLEMRDLAGALQLAEEVTPQVSASGSARLRGEALTVQADVLLEVLSRAKLDASTRTRLMREVQNVLNGAVEAFEAVVDLNPARKCHYLLARVHHELGNVAARDKHAKRFRQVSEFLNSEGLRMSGGTGGGGAKEPSEQPASQMPPPSPAVRQAPAASPPRWAAREFTASSHEGGLTGIAGLRNAPAPMGVQPAAPPVPAASGLGGGQPAAKTAPAAAGAGARCPALEQLLSLAEAAEALGGPAAAAAAATGNGAGTAAGWPCAGLLGGGGGSHRKSLEFGEPLQTDTGPVLGCARALYPMVAALGA